MKRDAHPNHNAALPVPLTAADALPDDGMAILAQSLAACPIAADS